MANDIHLIDPRECIPDRFRTVFPYELFNKVQSRCFKSIYETSDNVVVSAPTGSGKTALLELAICKLASQYVVDTPRNHPSHDVIQERDGVPEHAHETDCVD